VNALTEERGCDNGVQGMRRRVRQADNKDMPQVQVLRYFWARLQNVNKPTGRPEKNQG